MSFTFAVGSDPGAVRDKAREILARDEFQRTFFERLQEWLDAPLDAISTAVEWLIARFAGNDGGVAAALAWAFTLFIALLIVFFVVRLVHTTSAGDVVRGSTTRQQATTADALLEDAARFESQEDWRQAIRCRHAALIITLSGRGVVRRRKGMTAREYANEVGRNVPDVANAFDDATSLFEWVWYGGGVASEADVDRFRMLSVEVKKRVKA